MQEYGWMINEIKARMELENKMILEVGCGSGKMLKEIAVTCRPKEIIGIDLNLDEWWNVKDRKDENYSMLQGDINSFAYPDEYFDGIVTMATFEHIKNLDQALENMKRLLKPGGKIISIFNPIWTSVIGHHYNFWLQEENKLLPPWGHLWMTEDEMNIYLVEEKKIEPEKAREICHKVYHDDIINRMTRKDIYEAIISSGFIVRECREQIAFNRGRPFGAIQNELTASIFNRLCDRYSLADLAVYGFTVFLEKYRTACLS